MKTITCFFVFLLCCVSSVMGQSRGAASSSPMENYTLKPLDVLRVDVFQEPDLQKEVRVSAEGSITLPLIGEVYVKDMTVESARRLVTDRYNADYLVNPQVTMLVLSYQERRIHVHGQVNQPGPVLIPPEENMTLSQAISGARGLTRLADERNIRIKRVDASGRSRVIEVDFKEILQDPQAKDIPVYDGDNIFVRESTF
jgi:polysaccharide export outer membrane protein